MAYAILMTVADVTGSEIMQWINTSFMAAAVVMFAMGYIASMKVVKEEMLAPYRAENAELREAVKQLAATCEQQAKLLDRSMDELRQATGEVHDLRDQLRERRGDHR